MVSLCSGPWQSWQAGDSVAMRDGGSEGQSSAGVHMNDTWCPSHLWWCKRHPVPGKAKEQGGRGCLKELFLLENMTERVQQGGRAQSPAAETVGGRWKLKQHPGCVQTKKFGKLTMADCGTAGFKESFSVVCVYRSMLSYPISLSDFSVPDKTKSPLIYAAHSGCDSPFLLSLLHCCLFLPVYMSGQTLLMDLDIPARSLFFPALLFCLVWPSVSWSLLYFKETLRTCWVPVQGTWHCGTAHQLHSVLNFVASNPKAAAFSLQGQLFL